MNIGGRIAVPTGLNQKAVCFKQAHRLNRLPAITLKEGSRARVYIETDILMPSSEGPRPVPS